MTRNFFKYGVFGQCKGYLNDIYLNTMSCLTCTPEFKYHQLSRSRHKNLLNLQ